MLATPCALDAPDDLLTSRRGFGCAELIYNELVYCKCFNLVADKLDVRRHISLKPDEGGITDEGACAGAAFAFYGLSLIFFRAVLASLAMRSIS